MNAEKMKYEFQVRNELLPDLDLPDLEDDEINMFLNSAQIKVVENLYTQGITQLLTELYTTTSYTTSLPYTEGIDNSKVWTVTDLPSYMFLIDGSVLVDRIDNMWTRQRVKCTLIDKKDALKFASNQMNTVWFEFPKMFIDNLSIVAFTSSFDTHLTDETNNLIITYIKKPSLIDVTDNTGDGDCKLKEILHTDIVEEAVRQVTSTYKLKQNTGESK